MRLQRLLPKRVTVAFSVVRNDLDYLRRAFNSDRRPNFESRFSDAQLEGLLEKARQEESAKRTPKGSRERLLTVENVERTTSDSLTITFSQDAKHPLSFAPGQFVTLIADIDGQELRRAYSFCSDPADTEFFSISVKRVAQGAMSNHLNDSVRRGTQLRVSGPNGRFGASAYDGRGRHLVLIAGGSGITPLLSIARAVVRAEPESTVSLLYANRCSESVMHRDDLDQLTQAFDNLVVHHVLESLDEGSPPLPGTHGFSEGRVDETVFTRFSESCGVPEDAEYYLCGPSPMMGAVHELLSRRGVAESRIFSERFLDQSRHDSSDPADLVEYAIEYLNDAMTVSVKGGDTVLRGGLDAGLDMNFSCTMGGCAACKVQLISGEVEMSEPNCLTSEERDAGYILSCIACPRSDLKIER